MDDQLFLCVMNYVTLRQTRHLLAKLPKEKSVNDFLHLLDFFFLVPLPMIRDLEALDDGLKTIQDDVGKRGCVIAYADRSGARDCATELCLMLESEHLASQVHDHRTRNKLYNLIKFTLGHWKTFGPRLRHHMRRSAFARFPLSAKQRQEIEQRNQPQNQKDDKSDFSDSDSNDNRTGWSSDSALLMEIHTEIDTHIGSFSE